MPKAPSRRQFLQPIFPNNFFKRFRRTFYRFGAFLGTLRFTFLPRPNGFNFSHGGGIMGRNNYTIINSSHECHKLNDPQKQKHGFSFLSQTLQMSLPHFSKERVLSHVHLKGLNTLGPWKSFHVFGFVLKYECRTVRRQRILSSIVTFQK